MIYQLHDMIITTPEYGNRMFVIKEITKEGYKVISIKDKKRYTLSEKQISHKVGTVKENSPILFEDYFDEEQGRDYCLKQAQLYPEEAKKWMALSKLQNGRDIKILHRKTLFPRAEFIGINITKPLYPIRAKIKDLAHDFRLDSFLLDC